LFTHLFFVFIIRSKRRIALEELQALGAGARGSAGSASSSTPLLRSALVDAVVAGDVAAVDDVSTFAWKEARLRALDDVANGVGADAYPDWVAAAVAAIVDDSALSLAAALRREGDRGARGLRGEVCHSTQKIAEKATGVRTAHVTLPLLAGAGLSGGEGDDLCAVATKSGKARCAALLERVVSEWLIEGGSAPDLAPEDEWVVDVPSFVAWVTTTLGNDIALDMDGTRVTRTSSSSWGTQVSDPFDGDATISVKIDNPSSDYLAIGVVDAAWGWSGSNYVSGEGSSRYYYADGTLHKGGNTEQSGVMNMKAMGIELEVRIDATAKTVTFVREGDNVIGVLKDTPSSMRFFACFGGSDQFVTIVPSGGAVSAVARNGAGAAGAAASSAAASTGPLQVGDMVRVKPGLSKPQYGWGSVSAGDVGPIQSVDRR